MARLFWSNRLLLLEIVSSFTLLARCQTFFIATRIRNFYEIPYNLQYHADFVAHVRRLTATAPHGFSTIPHFKKASPLGQAA